MSLASASPSAETHTNGANEANDESTSHAHEEERNDNLKDESMSKRSDAAEHPSAPGQGKNKRQESGQIMKDCRADSNNSKNEVEPEYDISCSADIVKMVIKMPNVVSMINRLSALHAF